MAMSEQAKDLIMWVGSRSYPTWRKFADEAISRGVSKRIRTVPKGITLGVSKCWLIHGERVKTQIESTTHSYHKVGGMCRFCGIDRIANSQNPAPCRSHVLRRWGKPKRSIMGYFTIEEVFSPSMQDVQTEPARECGLLVPGAIYLRGPLTELKTPEAWPDRTFVGYRYYDRAQARIEAVV